MLGSLLTRATWPGRASVRISHPHSSGSFPSVSVIIPCYNYGHYIKQCVKSVLDQQGVTVDILVIDDASSDGSAEIVRQLPSQDARIRVICHAKNRGNVATVNEGIALARGDYTVLLSADDLLTPGSLARSTSLLEEYSSVGLAYGTPIVFTDTEMPSARTTAKRWIIWQGHSWITYACKTGRNVLRSPEAVIRTDVLRKIGEARSDLPHSGDFELWMRVATVSDVGYIAGSDQAYYRTHANNMHNSFSLLADIKERLRAFDVVFSERSSFLPKADKMRAAARRTLAHEALEYVINADAHGIADREPIDDYVTFALRTWPAARRNPQWRAFCKMRQGGGTAGRRLPLLAYKGMRRLKYSVRWRRQRLLGI